MNVNVEYFAQLRTAAGVTCESYLLPGSATVSDLLTHIRQRHPSLFGSDETIPSWITFVLREQTVGSDHPLQDGDTVRCLSPISGG